MYDTQRDYNMLLYKTQKLRLGPETKPAILDDWENADKVPIDWTFPIDDLSCRISLAKSIWRNPASYSGMWVQTAVL
jgi:hypothetical protein